MRKILLTGFEPFGSEKINPSWEVVFHFNGYVFSDFQVVSRQLPCTFGDSCVLLQQFIEEIEPEIILCVGQAGGRSEISLERVAINLIEARIMDNLGCQPTGVKVIDDAPDGYLCNLPLKALSQQIRNAGIPAGISYTAGTFVCNQVFFFTLDYIARFNPIMKGGFIHIPYLPEQAARLNTNQPSMDLATVIAGLKLLIAGVITIEREENLIAGTVC